MKSIVIYYSQTGNTKTVAQAIARGAEKENGQCDCVRLQNVTYEMLEEYDLIGFGTPIWGSCPTLNMVYFIKDMPDSFKSKHFFYFCTHGMTPGRGIIRGMDPMYERGLTVIGWKDWYGSASLPGHLKPWFTDGHPDDIDLAEAESFGGAMVRHSKGIYGGDNTLIPERMSKEVCDYIYGAGHPFLFSEEMLDSMEAAMPQDQLAGRKGPEDYPPLKYPSNMAYSAMIEGLDRKDVNAMAPAITFDADKCIGCNRCVQACYCENIDGSTTPPTIKNPYCEHCGFCEGVCPTGALIYPFRPAPVSEEATRADLAGYMKLLNDAEAKGMFRRLVKDEEIGWTTPWELATSHPRHKEIP